jgi:DNA-binding response OmpR family regulator
MALQKHILIVEDEKPLAKALAFKFEKEEYLVTNAYDGDEAIAAIKKNKESFDLMLLDLLLPKTDGFSLLEYMKKNNIKHPPVIITSNLSQDEDVTRAKELGAVDFMVKSNSSLSEIVARAKQFISES